MRISPAIFIALCRANKKYSYYYMSDCCKKLQKKVFGLQCYEPNTSIKRQKVKKTPRKPQFIVIVVDTTYDKQKECLVKKILDSHCCELYKYFSINDPIDDAVRKIEVLLQQYSNDPDVDFIHIGGLTSFVYQTTSSDLIREFNGRELSTYIPLYTQYSTQNADNNTIQGDIIAKSHFYVNLGKRTFTIMSTSSSSTDALNVALNRILGPEANQFLFKKLFPKI